MKDVGLSALSVALPATLRTNDHWRELHPDMVADAEQHALARLWATDGNETLFERAMAPYATDPFKGGVERRVELSETASVDLHIKAVQALVQAWSGGLEDIDFAIVSSMRPDTIAAGDASWLARRLDLACPAINVETACSSAVMSLDLACSLVESGRAERILVSAACTYARDVEETNSLAWFLADGAGAFIVERRAGVASPLGVHRISTRETCGAFLTEVVMDGAIPRIRMRATPGAGAILHETAEPYLRRACDGALSDAGVSLSDIALCVFNTPTAWYADFCADVLGVDRAKTVSVYRKTTNIGPALMTANLHHAASEGRLDPGDLVLIYSVGSASTAMAMVLRWGDIALSAPA
ncbi:MAG: ketoacyl-ACP synthase III family protein [Nannocystaceae bacterium]|nr:ketoacyl-ACP synthase III family protein [Nannocystaceae bacterium]